MRIALQSAALLIAVLPLAERRAAPSDMAALERVSKAGETLGAEVTAQHPLAEQAVKNDTGINVLIDLAHQASFFTMWRLPGELRQAGFRACGSQAALDTVLRPGKPSRARIPIGDRRPFAWWPNARFNVVITAQPRPNSEDYFPEEKDALKEFVRSGGGLIMVGGNVSGADDIKRWPLNSLAEEFGAQFSAESDSVDGTKTPSLQVGPGWEANIRGTEGRPVAARREYGKGRVALIGSIGLISWPKDKTEKARKAKAKAMGFLEETVKWAAAGAPPAGGSLRLPKEAGGGGPIYPELERRVGQIVVYYAKNLKRDLLEAISEDMPSVKTQIEEWLPSKPMEESMYLIMSAGGGGGWAVNAYAPKEVGIISLEKEGVLSVFAHELAHTMAGPPDDRGKTAGKSPFGNQGEAHAGWFQGKIVALRTGKQTVKDPNKLFTFDKQGNALDLATIGTEEFRQKWGKGKDWTKIWWVWQKLDDRYGPTWLPRWKWVQHTRWADDPERKLTWDETIEDMSIAVGEDLFPFFRKIGTTLAKERFERAVFRGETLELPIAPIEIGPAGAARLEAIGDYKKPLNPASSEGQQVAGARYPSPADSPLWPVAFKAQCCFMTARRGVPFHSGGTENSALGGTSTFSSRRRPFGR